MSTSKMKRFYKDVTVLPSDDGYTVQLDGRPLRTPMRNLLNLENSRLAEAIAEEWRAQKENIVPEAMPFTKLAFTAVDRVAPNRDAVIDQIAAFANSDVVCYRASEPGDLVERQQKDWDPVLNWAREDLGASFRTVENIEFIAQDHDAIAAVTEEISGSSDLFLTVLHTLAANSGSLLISLAVAKGRLEHSEAFRIANCDTLYQMERWGADSEAQSRLDMLAAEFESATEILKLLDE